VDLAARIDKKFFLYVKRAGIARAEVELSKNMPS
jgi:hypothetical protein